MRTSGVSLQLSLVVFALVSLLSAQSGSGTLTGTVKDATGAAIPGVSLKIVNEESGSKFALISNESGIYRQGTLLPGSYRLEAEAQGFDQLVQRNITIQVSQVTNLDITLTIGQQNQIVTVSEAPPLVDSQSSTVGQQVNRQMVAGLALPNRAASSLVALAPGVVMIDNGSGTAENYPVFTVAGGRARNQNFTLDGGNVSNAVGLTRPQQLTSLPMDAMQEFRVISNNYSAEFGHSTGGIVSMSTRSGTNQVHGSVFEYLRNDALDARNFFAARRTPIKLNQYGGTIGGPIRKDKTHFFASWEGTKQVTSTTTLYTVPTLAQRSGDFSGLKDSSGKLIPIYDPATTVGKNRQAFSGNIIPDSRFDPIAQAALAYWPLPNRTGTATGANNFGASNNAKLDRNIVVAKLDHQFRPTDQVSARYYINNSGANALGSYGIPVSDPDADITDVRVQSILGAYTHVFRPSLVNEFRATYLQRKFIDTRPGAGENYAQKIGLTGVSDAAFPTFTLPGYSLLGGNGAVSRIQTPIQDTQLQDSLSWYRGRHALKFGAEVRVGANNEIRDRSSSGSFGITPLITGKPGVANTGNSLASFLLGEVNSASIQVSDKIQSRAQYMAYFAQDDWRLTDRLTLNLGIRYEAELPRYEANDKQSSFDPLAINPVSGTPGIVTFSGQNGVPRRAFNTDWNNFGPRVGLAYRVNGLRNTVFRAGAGFFYGPTVSNTIGDVASTGYSTQASLVVSQADLQSALKLRNGLPASITQRPALTSAFGAVPLGTKPIFAASYFWPDQVAPTSYQYNANIQTEPVKDVLLEIGYIANVSHHLTGNDLSINQVAPQLMGAGDAQSRRPFPQFSNVTLLNPSIGNSTYHGGYIKAERRFAHGLSFLAHYTYSKFIDDVAAANEYGDPQSYMDAYNRRLDKGLSGSDVPHRVVVSGLYQTPDLKQNKLMKYAFGHWQVGMFGTFQSGAPFTIVSAANTTNAFPAGPVRPVLLRDATLSGSNQTLARWFDTSAFAAPAQFTFGNSPRSVLRGGNLQTIDLTLSKEFAVTERWKVDLRGEFFNLLNRANFLLPGHTFGAADFGSMTSANPARAVQVSMRLSF
jgi:hypothetical protein